MPSNYRINDFSLQSNMLLVTENARSVFKYVLDFGSVHRVYSKS